MTSMKISVSAVCLPLLILCGCNDPMAATKENFHNILTDLLDTRCFLVGPEASTYPVQLSDSDEIVPYDTLVKVHLLDRRGDGLYDLTEKGKNILQLPHGKSGKLVGFCAYHIDVGEIQTISNVRMSGGYTIRDVTFDYKRRDEPWASDPAVQLVFQRQFIPMDKQTWTLPMILTKRGWNFVDRILEDKDDKPIAQ